MSRNETATYKGIAILIVILCHTAGTFGNGITVFTPLGGIGVSIFLLLSAYGLNESWLTRHNSGGGTRCWWRKRFIAVWIPYIIIQLIAYWPFHEFQPIPFFFDLILIKPLYHNGWYLQYLFMWYVIFFMVRRIKGLDEHRLLIFSAVSVVLFVTLREIKAEQSMSFLLGILLSERKVLQSRLFRAKYGVILLGFGIGCLAFKQMPIVRAAPQIVMNTVQLGIKLPIGLGLVILAHEILKKRKLKALYSIGTISYELYLIHGYVLSAVPVSMVGMVLFVFITAVVSIGFWWIMKKMKPLWYRIFRVESNVY